MTKPNNSTPPITQELRKTCNAYSAFEATQLIQKIAAAAGFDWDHPVEVLANVREETEEILAELSKLELNQDRLLDEYSDLLFVVMSLARHLQLTPEAALEYANKKFIGRFSKVEAMVIASARSMKELEFDELLAYWEEAKAL